jgi:hypothetical protein
VIPRCPRRLIHNPPLLMRMYSTNSPCPGSKRDDRLDDGKARLVLYGTSPNMELPASVEPGPTDLAPPTIYIHLVALYPVSIIDRSYPCDGDSSQVRFLLAMIYWSTWGGKMMVPLTYPSGTTRDGGSMVASARFAFLSTRQFPLIVKRLSIPC